MFVELTPAQGSTLNGSLQAIKFYVLGSILVCAFLVFNLCIRDADAVGYLGYSFRKQEDFDHALEVPLAQSRPEQEVRRQLLVADMTTRQDLASSACAHSAFSYACGFRFFYLAFCVGGWIASPIACLVVTCLVIVFMGVFDRDKYQVEHDSQDGWQDLGP